MKKYIFKTVICLVMLTMGLLWTASLSAEQKPISGDIKTTVCFAEIDGVIGVPIEEHVENVFAETDKIKKPLLIFKLNTPGGLVDSMSVVMTKIAESDYPVVVWVAPSGARAASAGAFIVQAAHVAVMAPGTNIGAAHPVMSSGGDIQNKEMNRKITNDLTAKIRSFAQERGRNVAAVESMVTKSTSLTAREALSRKVIDFCASDEEELLKLLDGRKVTIKGKKLTISLKGHETKYIDITPRLKMLGIFSRPDIAYLALIAGIFLILIEFKAPGGYVMGVSGAVLLLVASYGLRVLPVNMVGMALLIGGVMTIIADILIGGVGIIAVAGFAAMLFGGLMLFQAPGGELLRAPIAFIVGVTVVTGLIFLLVAWLVSKALRAKASLGEGALIGKRITISARTEKNMMATLHGEYWRVMPIDPDAELSVGDEVEVVKVESLVLYVKPVMRV